MRILNDWGRCTKNALGERWLKKGRKQGNNSVLESSFPKEEGERVSSYGACFIPHLIVQPTYISKHCIFHMLESITKHPSSARPFGSSPVPHANATSGKGRNPLSCLKASFYLLSSAELLLLPAAHSNIPLYQRHLKLSPHLLLCPKPRLTSRASPAHRQQIQMSTNPITMKMNRSSFVSRGTR